MPAVVAKGAIIAVSIAVAMKAAIAVYESPQARQFAEDVRRKIAIALHSLGDEINPASQQPRFNRPEDAEGFLRSQASGENGVDADEETKKRQREELMYWNAVHMEKMEKERLINGKRPRNERRSTSFDDFLQQDASAEKGTFVYNSGADVNNEEDQGLRQRGIRGMNMGSAYANPFDDEHNIDMDEQRATDASLMSPDASEKSEAMSEDLYSASNGPLISSETREADANLIHEQLVDTSEPTSHPDPPISLPDLNEPWQGQESTDFTNMTRRDDSAYASIHAWADDANNSFYSPLPATPRAASPQSQQQPNPSSPVFSDPPESVPGDLTPTDSMSVADSGDDVWAPTSGATSDGDVMSLDGEAISTPGSWTEVGSVVSENDAAAAVVNH